MLTSTHPLPTWPRGADPMRSAVNHFGECHGGQGLFVADTSIFPTSLGASPQITTAALANRAAGHVLGK